MKNQLPISVIIPCFNSSETIKHSVASIIKQKSIPKEVILIDDYSNDDNKTLTEIKKCIKLLNNNKIKTKLIINKSNKGPAASRNEGISIAKGKYLAFLDSDDFWLKEKLEYQYKIMENNRNFFLSCHDSYFINNEKREKIETEQLNSIIKKIYLPNMFFKNFVQTRTVMVKNNEKILFNDKLRYAEDYDLWLRLMIKKHEFYYINNKLACCYTKNGFSEGLSSHFFLFWMNEILVLFFNSFRSKKFIIFLPFILIFSSIKFILRLLKFKISSFGL